MSERIHVLAQQLLNQPDVASCSVQSIRELASRYPYFAPAQFLLLEKLRETGDPAYAEQLQKAVLYYHNPVAFDHFLSPDKFITELDLEPVTTEPITPEPEDPIPTPIVEIPEKPEQEPTEKTEAPTEQTEAQQSSSLPPQPSLSPLPVSDLSFEPYHTVDYFASQGIKLSEREAGGDKFGKQLKSFTEWLKTMKRLPQQAQARSLDSSTEQNVQHLAADSVNEAEVVTEAMAEVWVKQGNNARAAEVYRKLSLQNPSKNAYFAAKIDQLKSST